MVQEPAHVKQLSPIHVCKIGLRVKKVSICFKGGERYQNVSTQAIPCATAHILYLCAPCCLGTYANRELIETKIL